MLFDSFCYFFPSTHRSHPSLPSIQYFLPPYLPPSLTLTLTLILTLPSPPLCVIIHLLAISFFLQFFWVWLISLSIIFTNFIHLPANAIFYHSLWLSNIPLYIYTTVSLSIHQLKDIYVGSTIWLLWIEQLWTLMWLYLCSMLILRPLGIGQGVG